MPPTHTDEGLARGRDPRALPETGVLVLSQHLEPHYAMRLIEQPRPRGYLLKERVGRARSSPMRSAASTRASA